MRLPLPTLGIHLEGVAAEDLADVLFYALSGMVNASEAMTPEELRDRLWLLGDLAGELPAQQRNAVRASVNQWLSDRGLEPY